MIKGNFSSGRKKDFSVGSRQVSLLEGERFLNGKAKHLPVRKGNLSQQEDTFSSGKENRFPMEHKKHFPFGKVNISKQEREPFPVGKKNIFKWERETFPNTKGKRFTAEGGNFSLVELFR